MEKVELIIISPEDWQSLSEIAKIESEAFSGDGLTPANLVLMAKAGFVFGLRKESKIIAEAIVIHTFAQDACFLFSFAVGSHFRKQGIGKLFLRLICNYLSRKGLSSIELTVSPENLPAVSLYIDKFGFEKMHFGKDYLGPGHDRLILRKILERGKLGVRS